MRTMCLTRVAVLCLTLLALLCALGGCGGSAERTAALTPDASGTHGVGPLDIPLPSEMAAGVDGGKNVSAATLYRKGAEYLNNVHQNLASAGDAGVYSPSWAGNWSGFSAIAFGGYRLNIVGSTVPAVVHLDWTTPPADVTNIYIGLSNWIKDMWVWYQLPADGSLEIGNPGLSQFAKVGSGDVLVAVVALGQDSCTLDQLWLGNVFPVHTISGTVTTTTGIGIAGVNVGFSGGLTSVVTNAAGYYERDAVYDGTYTITPSKSGFTFTPSYKNTVVHGADMAGNDFSTSSAQGEWWMFGRDKTHSRRSTLNGAQTNAIRWQYNTGSLIDSSPAVSANGVLYFGAANGKLYAVNADGTLRWNYTTSEAIWSSPAVGADGNVYFGSLDNNVYALDSTGGFLWTLTTGDDVYSSPCIGADGTIYIGSCDDKLYAINPDGTKKWDYATGGDVLSSPAVGLDGKIYVGSADTKLYAINPDGSFAWEYATGGEISFSSPGVGPDGTIMIGSYDGKLHAVNPDGSANWTYTTGDKIWGSPAVGSDGTAYVGSWDGSLYAINPGGTLKWTYPTGGQIYASPMLAADGTIYFGSNTGSLYAVNSSGGPVWSLSTGANFVSSPIIGADGSIYAGCENGRLYACGSGGLTYAVSGYVKDASATGISGVTISFDGLPSVTTDSTGYWQASNVPSGNYTATPALAGYNFVPASQDFNVIAANVTLPDFLADPIGASGYVKDAGGAGIPGVTLTFTNGVPTTTTDANGFWQTGALANGSYTVTPSKTGYQFAPVNRAFTMAGVEVNVPDFTGDTNIASGYCKDGGGLGIANVMLNFTGGLVPVMTDASGYWERDAIPNGSYTVTPVKNGWTFDPASRNFTISGNDQLLGDFTGTGGGTIEIVSITTDKTTHCSDLSEPVSHLEVITDPTPADTYAWSGPGDFSSTTIANPTWKPNASTALGKATLTVEVSSGAATNSGTINMYVTTETIKGSWTDRDGGFKQIGDPPGSGHAPDFDMSPLQYLEPLSMGGDITTYNGTFHQWIDGKVVLFDRWELWCGPCKAEYPTLDSYGETYGPNGFLFTANGDDASPYSVNEIKAWFQSNAIDYCNHFHGNIVSQWMTLGADNYIPFNLLLDRDGYVRKVGGAATGSDWVACIEDLLGI